MEGSLPVQGYFISSRVDPGGFLLIHSLPYPVAFPLLPYRLQFLFLFLAKLGNKMTQILKGDFVWSNRVLSGLVNRFQVGDIVQWSCSVKRKTCQTTFCDEDETLEQGFPKSVLEGQCPGKRSLTNLPLKLLIG